jgi:hypothetical protein
MNPIIMAQGTAILKRSRISANRLLGVNVSWLTCHNPNLNDLVLISMVEEMIR